MNSSRLPKYHRHHRGGCGSARSSLSFLSFFLSFLSFCLFFLSVFPSSSPHGPTQQNRSFVISTMYLAALNSPHSTVVARVGAHPDRVRNGLIRHRKREGGAPDMGNVVLDLDHVSVLRLVRDRGLDAGSMRLGLHWSRLASLQPPGAVIQRTAGDICLRSTPRLGGLVDNPRVLEGDGRSHCVCERGGEEERRRR